MAQWIGFFALLLVTFAHSFLGERFILQPLFKERSWTLKIPRFAATRILRFAWHLTSFAWLGMAFTLVGVSSGIAIGVTCLLSAATVFCSLRGHLAWPIFLVAGLGAFHASEALPSWVFDLGIYGAALVALVAAIIHVYWGFGGRKGFAAAVPAPSEGKKAFTPGMFACLSVSALLVFYTALLFLPQESWVRVMTLMALGVLVLRAVGDTKSVGFSKSEHESLFAKYDDALYTPLVVVLAFGALAALSRI